MSIAEIIGYVASGIIAISMTMSSVLRLRILNMTGGILMVGYAAIISAWPVALVNAMTAIINAVQIVRLLREPAFRLLELNLAHPSAYVVDFLRFYDDDMHRFQPRFDLSAIDQPQGFFILRDSVPVGLLIYELRGEQVAWVHLDYVAPPYRDLKNARYAYDAHAKKLAADGFREWRTTADLSPGHMKYMKRIGFRVDPAHTWELVRTMLS